MAVDTVKWNDQNGDPFDVVEVTADDTLRVDLVGRDVHTGDLLIDSGSESVGYWSFNADQYRKLGCQPAPEQDSTTPAHAADNADGSPAAGQTDTAAADQSPTGSGSTAGE